MTRRRVIVVGAHTRCFSRRVFSTAGRPIGYGPGGPLRAGGLVAANGLVHDTVVAKLASGGV